MAPKKLSYKWKQTRERQLGSNITPAIMEMKTVKQTCKDEPREVLEVILLEVGFGIFFPRNSLQQADTNNADTLSYSLYIKGNTFQNYLRRLRSLNCTANSRGIRPAIN